MDGSACLLIRPNRNAITTMILSDPTWCRNARWASVAPTFVATGSPHRIRWWRGPDMMSAQCGQRGGSEDNTGGGLALPVSCLFVTVDHSDERSSATDAPTMEGTAVSTLFMNLSRPIENDEVRKPAYAFLAARQPGWNANAGDRRP